MVEVEQYFDNFLTRKSLFKNKEVLNSSYLPEEVLYREEQIQEIAHILAPALRSEKSSNLFIYGKTGTGKTLSIKHILRSLSLIATKNNIPLKTIYINCKLRKV